MPEQNQQRSLPSHGRGRRFNPYSAHQRLPNKSKCFASQAGVTVGNSRQNMAGTCASNPGKIRGICSADVRNEYRAQQVLFALPFSQADLRSVVLTAGKRSRFYFEGFHRRARETARIT